METQTWNRLVDSFSDVVAQSHMSAALVNLMREIAASRYAIALHPITQHQTLVLFAHAQFDPRDDQIRIEHDGQEFRVEYTAALGLRHRATPLESTWQTRDTNGFRALERCLAHVRWFVDEVPVRSAETSWHDHTIARLLDSCQLGPGARAF